jgi:5-methylcytosine-specific restriction endonuclease McrA
MSLGACPALDASVLVLNKCYLAVHIIPVRRAFCLLFKELAEVITLDDGRYLSHDFDSWRAVSEARARFKDPDDDFIRTIHFEIQVPRVIRLLTYDRLPRTRVKFNRRNIFARDGNRCQYCDVRKGGRTPSEAGMRLTKPPIKPRTSPTLGLKLANRKYQSWKTFLDDAYWTVELK